MQFVKSILSELLDKDIEIKLKIDNQSAIKMIKSGKVSRNTKHIDVRYHFICDQLDEGLFSLDYCSTENQIADIFTKPM
jgi:KUP system potassium uptake protein